MTKRYRVIIEPEALLSLESAYLWIAERASARANKWVNGLIQAIESLEFSPRRCQIAPESQFFV